MDRAQEARALKIAGLVAIALSFAALIAVGERIASADWRSDIASIAIMGAGWLALAHVFAAGFILLLGGLKSVPLLTDARARRGAWTKLAGTSLLALCVGIVAVEDSGAIPSEWLAQWEDSWLALPAALLLIVAFVFVARKGVLLLRTGWKYEAISAEQLMADDPRAPVIYLRAFREDDRITLSSRGLGSRLAVALNYMAAVSPEQEVAAFCSSIGPVIAIGKPGEPLPELGAARLYVPDDRWRTTIADLIARARLVVIRTGDTPNLLWEIEQTLALTARRRVMLVSLGSEEETGRFDAWFDAKFGAPTANPAAPSSPGRELLTKLLTFRLSDIFIGRIIYFDGNLAPREEPIRFRTSIVAVALLGTRPYRDSLRSALKRVFRSLGLRWGSRRNQSAAVLLAMWGGGLGLHHFYLGNRHAGFVYLGLAWILVPMLLGWIDAVRLALIDARTFESRYARTP